MGVISKFVKFNGLAFTGGALLTAYSYPELRQEPRELMHAMFRGLRVVKAGSLMVSDYMNVSTMDDNRL